ncbi:cytidine deaminase [Phenylobacterium sp.]|uniref:cytidine deaminase family protein n=1 Tax=Phenylobacterium sp. TaxID=1871053 RepID=UPI00260D66B9|nr:cytidine deaminase [Phenylobacterium sp.]
MTTDELIERAASVLNPHTTSEGRLFGDVGAALISERGNVYTGVCIDTASWGLCAERSAIAAMATAGEYRIKQVVAVWRDESNGSLSVLPPCGVCREFMRRIDEGNLDADVLLGRDKAVKLRDLIPHHEWPAPLA